MQVFLTHHFSRMFDNLEHAEQEMVLERIALLKDRLQHQALRVHKLHGKYKDCYAFSIDHYTRIVFQYSAKSKNIVYLLSIGDHTVYD